MSEEVLHSVLTPVQYLVMSKSKIPAKRRASARKYQPTPELTGWQKAKVFVDGLNVITWLVDLAQKIEEG